MTPQFYAYFNIFKRTLSAYNSRCDCKGVWGGVTFEQSLGTKNANEDTTIWTGTFKSDVFGEQRFGGTMERVSDLVGTFIKEISQQTLEACMANAEGKNGWFNDKPEVVKEIYDIYSQLVSTELKP